MVSRTAFLHVAVDARDVERNDHVLLELDAEKRGRYLENLGSYTQAFFTFLPQEKYFDSSFDISGNDSKVYTVKEGMFIDENE